MYQNAITSRNTNVIDSENCSSFAQKADDIFISFAESSSDIIVVANSEGRVVYLNPEAKNYLPYPHKNLDKPVIQYIHDDDQDTFLRKFSRIFDNKESIYIQYRYRMINGDFCWLKTYGGPLLDKEGKVFAAVFCIHPLAKQNKFEHKPSSDGLANIKVKQSRPLPADLEEYSLLSTREFFYSIYQAMPCAISVTSIPDGTFWDVNSTFSRYTGYDSVDILGNTSKAIGLWVNPADRRQFISALIENGYISNMEYAFRHKKGRQIKSLLTAIKVIIKNKPCAITTAMDMTNTNQIQFELERIGRLYSAAETAAAIVHEIKNPLTTIKGFLQLFMEEHSSICQDSFQILLEELDSINNIINEYLGMFKYREPVFQKADLNLTIKSIYPLLQSCAVKNNHKVDFIPGYLPLLFYDEKQIRQLVFNLVLNGLQAMEKSGTVTVSTFTHGDSIILSISDEGPGIDTATLSRISEPFFSTKENGMGIGLVICHNIVQKHNAVMDVITGKNGTRFTIKFKAS